MNGTVCTDDARVKVHSFQKVTFLLQYEIFHRDAIHLFFVCMKMFLTAVTKDNTLQMPIRFNQTPLFLIMVDDSSKTGRIKLSTSN